MEAIESKVQTQSQEFLKNQALMRELCLELKQRMGQVRGGGGRQGQSSAEEPRTAMDARQQGRG